MDAKTRAQLVEVNRAFYEGTADAFSDTRRDPWPGWKRAMTHVKPAHGEPLNVLDVGCGNGRFARYLADHPGNDAPNRFHYLGIDSSRGLLDHARRANADLANVEFEDHDVLHLEDQFVADARRFDVIAAFGVLHHIPGATTRRALVETLVSLLSDRGVLIVTAWQFGTSERFRSRRIDWTQYNEDAIDPINEAELEEGDYLLRFANSPLPRYCHFASADELRDLFAGSNITWLDEYCEDGKTRDLNQYAVVTPRHESTH